MHTAIKVLAVVVVSAFAGWLGTSAICARVYQGQEPSQVAERPLTLPEHRQNVPDDTHMRVMLDQDNFGGEGVLEVRGKFEIVNPDMHMTEPSELDVWLRIGDENGDQLLPLIKIDHVTVQRAVGHWSKGLNWVLPLDRGTYSVGLYVGTENMVSQNEPNSIFPSALVGHRTLMKVE
jgi:hypothetical protein